MNDESKNIGGCMSLVNEFATKLIVNLIEKWLGKIAKKFTVSVKDEGEQFTITITVFETMANFIKGTANTLSGLVKKK